MSGRRRTPAQGLALLRELLRAPLLQPPRVRAALPGAPLLDARLLATVAGGSWDDAAGQRPEITPAQLHQPTGSSSPTESYDESDPDPEHQRIAALVRLAQQGNRDAFLQIYERYVTQVHTYVYHRTGSVQLAEDITSETFLKALRRIDTFSWSGRDIGAWLITIARNLTIDHFRSASYRLEVVTDDLLQSDRPDDGIEHVVMERLESAALVEALRRLKPEQQECLVLRFLQGLSVAETARVLNRTEGAVKQLQLRAMRTLARNLPAKGEIGLT